MISIEGGVLFVLIFCVLAVCFFEFINGFHDTANAVATVIYTHSLKPRFAVVWSGIFNFLGLLVSAAFGYAVAMGIINLLPLSILIDQNTAHSVALILALTFTAIIWNLGTWYFGIPCSSSHTLLGSIFGVCIAYGLTSESGVISSLNWMKVKDAGLSLLLSPVFGFGLTLGLVLLIKKRVKSKKLFSEPDKKKAPPLWIRIILIFTCSLVSFFHGWNDGQKGIGLMMIILIALAPVFFALDHSKHPEKLLLQVNNIETVISKVDSKTIEAQLRASLEVIKEKVDTMKSILTGIVDFKSLKKEANFEIRKDILIISKETDKILKKQIDVPALELSNVDKETLRGSVKLMKGYTEYAPWWVLIMISISLGIGTMIGWKRIVVTIGEKIGKEHLTYAQGASAELVAASTIAASSWLGLPVSTTHVLSSGVGGSMVATKGLKNLRAKTVKNILIAWLITVPVTILMAGGLFLLFRLLF